MAIACPAMVHEVRDLDDELAVLRKELGALTSDACAPEIGLYWRGEGPALRRLASELEKIARLAADREKLEQARAHALELIYDREKYFYPYYDRADEYRRAQQEVEERVKAVRALRI